MSNWSRVVFEVYSSKHCKIQDWRTLYYDYSTEDFLTLVDNIHQMDAIEVAVNRDAEANERLKSAMAGRKTT